MSDLKISPPNTEVFKVSLWRSPVSKFGYSTIAIIRQANENPGCQTLSPARGVENGCDVDLSLPTTPGVTLKPLLDCYSSIGKIAPDGLS